MLLFLNPHQNNTQPFLNISSKNPDLLRTTLFPEVRKYLLNELGMKQSKHNKWFFYMTGIQMIVKGDTFLLSGDKNEVAKVRKALWLQFKIHDETHSNRNSSHVIMNSENTNQENQNTKENVITSLIPTNFWNKKFQSINSYLSSFQPHTIRNIFNRKQFHQMTKMSTNIFF
jgi:hypothetical protein